MEELPDDIYYQFTSYLLMKIYCVMVNTTWLTVVQAFYSTSLGLVNSSSPKHSRDIFFAPATDIEARACHKIQL
jgi:hypothetical protein